MASGNIRDPCLAGLSPARSQPRRHGFSLTDSYRVPWYDYAVTHLRETGLSEDEARLVMNHLDASTARNYTGKYSEFALSFCEPRGLCPCPADTNTIVKYLSWQADKGTVAATSLPQYLSAIGCRHTDVGLPSPCTGSSDPGVTDFCPIVSHALTGYAKGFTSSGACAYWFLNGSKTGVGNSDLPLACHLPVICLSFACHLPVICLSSAMTGR